MQVYLAAPLFSNAERQYNMAVTNELEVNHTIHLPQREMGEIEAVQADHADDVAMQMVYDADREAVLEADAMVAILDGQTVDEGTAVEMAIASEHDIPVVGLRSDWRVFAPNQPVNAMVFGVTDVLATSVAEVDAVLTEI